MLFGVHPKSTIPAATGQGHVLNLSTPRWTVSDMSPVQYVSYVPGPHLCTTHPHPPPPTILAISGLFSAGCVTEIDANI
jgi:hypothetical protein